QQLMINGILLAFMAGMGIYLIFFSQEEKIITKFKRIKEQIEPNKITKANYQKVISELDDDEKKVFEIILNAQGSVFQSELVSKTGLTKVKVTRILDRLEGKGLIERKRRGMTNVVVLRH
ncbi:MarR family transcriptional regulator, partial [Candidatus Woesearchaeota archaeon]|nr:MarR family transcriptional regulator [Candidatus Woesearchaeota archaeon]